MFYNSGKIHHLVINNKLDEENIFLRKKRKHTEYEPHKPLSFSLFTTETEIKDTDQ